MPKFLKLLLVLVCLLYSGQCFPQFCKWVDENGVSHYAETCPEDVDGQQVNTDPGPSQELVEAAQARSGSLEGERAAQREQAQLIRQQEQASLVTRQKASGENIQRCAQARISLEVLRKPLPVYYDQARSLHFNRSRHDRWYQGTRTYLEDAQRQAEIERFGRVEAETCTDNEADIRERIRIYMQTQEDDICGLLRQRLASLRRQNTGIPSDEMRELQELVETRCS
jgi:hypothetical protein